MVMSEKYSLDYSLHRLKPTLEGAQEQANGSGKTFNPPAARYLFKNKHSCSTKIYLVVF